jgi:hypothetical protein
LLKGIETTIARVSTLEETPLVKNFKALSNLGYLQQVFQLVDETVRMVGPEVGTILDEERKLSKTLCELLSRPKVKEIYRPQIGFQYVGVTATKLWLNNRVKLIILSTEDATFVYHDDRFFYSSNTNSHCPSSYLVEKRLQDFENTEDIRARSAFHDAQYPSLVKKEVMAEASWKTKTFYPVVDAVVLDF